MFLLHEQSLACTTERHPYWLLYHQQYIAIYLQDDQMTFQCFKSNKILHIQNKLVCCGFRILILKKLVYNTLDKNKWIIQQQSHSCLLCYKGTERKCSRERKEVKLGETSMQNSPYMLSSSCSDVEGIMETTLKFGESVDSELQFNLLHNLEKQVFF